MNSLRLQVLEETTEERLERYLREAKYRLAQAEMAFRATGETVSACPYADAPTSDEWHELTKANAFFLTARGHLAKYRRTEGLSPTKEDVS